MPMSSQPGTSRQSVNRPPVTCADAFEQVAGEASLREPVVVGPRPAERVHHRAERHGGVDAAPGDDHVRAAVERAAIGCAPR